MDILRECERSGTMKPLSALLMDDRVNPYQILYSCCDLGFIGCLRHLVNTEHRLDPRCIENGDLYRSAILNAISMDNVCIVRYLIANTRIKMVDDDFLDCAIESGNSDMIDIFSPKCFGRR